MDNHFDFTSLPSLVQEKILNYILQNTKLKTHEKLILRLVDKNWMLAIDRLFKIDDLIINNGFKQYNHHWFTTTELTDCSLIYRDKWQTILEQSIFSSLRRLLIHDGIQHFNYNPLLNQLNKLTNLQILELYSISIYSDSLSSIHHSNVKFLKIRNIDIISELKIDMPKLIKLCVGGDFFKYFKFVNPTSIVYLEIEGYIDRLDQFDGLEYLYLRSNKQLINDDLLSKLVNLKKIHCYSKSQFETIKQQKNKLGRNQLKIYFRGVQTDHIDNNGLWSMDDEWYMGGIWNYQMINYSQLDDKLPFNNLLHYEYLDNNFKTEEWIPSTLSTKLVNLNYIDLKISTDLDYNKLNRFLNECKTIYHLRICGFNNHQNEQIQEFLNNLPKIKPNLSNLEISPQKHDTQNEFNLDFLIEFKKLSGFGLDLNLTRNEIIDTFNRTTTQSIRLLFKSKYIDIGYNYGMNEWILFWHRPIMIYLFFDNLEQLLNHLEIDEELQLLGHIEIE